MNQSNKDLIEHFRNNRSKKYDKKQKLAERIELSNKGQ